LERDFYKNTRMPDVYTAFKRQKNESEIIEFSNNGWLIHPGGHFQGIQRMDFADFTYFIITGSSEDEAYFIIVGKTSDKYEIIQKKVISKNPYRHAGGIQVVGDYIVVGIEDNQKQNVSQVLIFDIKEPDKPIGEPILVIHREGKKKLATAGAVAMTKIGREYLLIVGSWDSDTLDFYRSNGRNLGELNTDGKSLCEFNYCFTWNKDYSNRNGWCDSKWGNYQNINLINDLNDNMFLIGYYFDEEKGFDYKDLFSLHLDKPIPEMIKKESSKRMVCKNGASFNYCGGSFVKDENIIISYACSADCSDRGVINEFDL
jgi:hypothetical protein